MKRSFFLALTLGLALPILLSCTSYEKRKCPTPETVHASDSEDIRAMLQSLRAGNDLAPATYSASFLIEGKAKNKKFKSTGKIVYDKKAKRMSVAFRDYIFKSSIMQIFIEGDEIVLYFPVDKKIVKDNRRTINLLNYNNLDVEYDILYDLLVGKVPLISDYKVKQGLVGDRGVSYLILENDEAYQTVSFKNSVPDRIKLLQKSNKGEIEIYLKKRVKTKDSAFFRSIMMVRKKDKARMTITFNKISFNRPVKVKTIKDIKIPRDVEVITM